MTSITKIAASLLLTVFCLTKSNAQITIGDGTGDSYLNTVTTAVPFLRIAPDARSGGMADAGIAISPDANSIFWNASKLAFVEDNSGLSITYTPWLRNLVNDIYLAYLNGFWKVDDLQTLGASLRYFSLGSITFTDASGNVLQDFRPNEFAFDVAYARKLADNLSAGLDLKYIYSNLATGQFVNGIPIKPANGVAADISLFYHNEFEQADKDAYFNAGLNISNIGNKITYTNSIEKDFIPTNLGVGVAYGVNFDDYNQLTIALDFNKLLVPTPDSTDVSPADGIFDYKQQGVVSGIFSSFSDAPRGFSEEIKEVILSAGLEYWYNKQFAVRAGYFNEAPEKGNRQFFTVGLGLKYNVFGLDFSYLIPSSNSQNPLDNTLRFTLAFDFASLQGENGDSEDMPE
ncbi:MAG: type IX secretion system outer membrane channel protein PorV [Chitinophagales bacterium]